MTDNNINSYHSNLQPLTQTSAAICVIQKQGLRYVDEWVDYHIGIGFTTIYIYDNSEDFELKEWHSKRFLQQSITTGSNSNRAEPSVQIIHWPGTHAGGQQLPAYSNCTKTIQKHNNSHDWIAFIDLDEFFVIKDTNKYPFITNVLDSVSSNAGGLAVNWQFFDFNNQTKYEAKPLTMRFTRRKQNNPTNIHVKMIARNETIKDVWPTPHEVRYKNKTEFSILLTVDTNGDTVKGPFNHKVPTDVLVLHHYGSKSVEEFRSRCARGRPTVKGGQYDKKTYLACKSEEEVLDEWRSKEDGTEIYDDYAWLLLKERVPAYRIFETQYEYLWPFLSYESDSPKKYINTLSTV